MVDGAGGRKTRRRPGASALAALPDEGCRWPEGDPRNAGFAFCGAAREPGSPYCPEHRARARPAGSPPSWKDLLRGTRGL